MQRTACTVLLVLLGIAWPGRSGAEEAPEAVGALPRRAFLGVGLAPAPGGGVLVEQAGGDGTAAAIGLAAGDVILEADGSAIADVAALVTWLRQTAAGDDVALVVRRGEERVELTGEAVGRPLEQLAEATVEYGHATVPAGYRVRTILTVPPDAEGPVPAVFFIQGLGCSSIDRPFDGDRAVFTRLAREVARRGIATLRVDKPGVGDSEGPPCPEIDFEEELAANVAALAMLKADPRIDPARIVIFGHSMGGVMGPMAAREVEVAGIAVYGSVVRRWLEYVLENRRRQLPMYDMDPVEEEMSQGLYEAFMVRLHYDQLTPAEVVARHPHLAGAVEHVDDTHVWGRHARFFHQLQEIRLAGVWAELGVRALAMHGAYDWVSPGPDHARIAAIANHVHPGSGRWLELDGLDHAWTRHPSLEASYGRMGQGTPAQDEVLAPLLELVAATAEPLGDRPPR